MMYKKREYALSLGSNLGDRQEHLCQALQELPCYGRIVAQSKIYQTKPMYVEDQPEFLNMAVIFETELSPKDLLAALKSIEQKIGRQKTIRRGPREVDVDIILLKEGSYQDEDLQIPHLLYQERDFVLIPLSEIAPNWRDPNGQQTLEELAELLVENTVQEYV